MKKLVLFFEFLLILFVLSCLKNQEVMLAPIIEPKIPKIETITLTFAGDIMAHDTNFKMKDYNKIYEDLAGILLEDDLSFGNIEMPVCDSLPMSNYPNFNVHSSYVKACIDGGFEVLAFANNHTNDQGVKGIDGTLKSIEGFEAEYNSDGQNIWFSGLKKTVEEEIAPITIEKNGFKIGYLSVTEILNSHNSSKHRLYYSEPTNAGRKKLLNLISEYTQRESPDLFVLSLHLFEEEYGRTVKNTKKDWFTQLENAGVDIICASHPHVMQTWEKSRITDASDENVITKEPFRMYSMGNFISAQRVIPNYANPTHYREYTGDAVLLQLSFTKIDGKLSKNYTVKPYLVTVYNGKDGLVMKQFTPEWIESLTESREKNYYNRRLELMKEYLPLEE